MAKEFWFYETPFPLSYIGYYYLENKWLSYYRNIPTATVSASSKQDLISLGFKNIFMVTEGLNVQPLPKLSEKESTPTMIFIGRLKKAKLPDHAISAFSIIKKRKPDARLWVIGDGYLRTALKQLYLDGVTFYGYINGDTKNKLLARAHMILVPSVREGWGLVVTEANAMGTPAVAYNVPGLRDSVRDGITGLLVKSNTPESMAESALRLLENPKLLNEISINALDFSRNFDWNITANEFDALVKSIASKGVMPTV
jgi:glycosyltransferase involved in cell wall biosynthesis